MPVRVTFERYDDVWLPMFEPDPDARGGGAMNRIGERAAVISGVGQSQIGRRIYRDPARPHRRGRAAAPSTTPG